MGINQNTCHLAYNEKKSGKYKPVRHFDLLLFRKKLLLNFDIFAVQPITNIY